MNVPGFVPAMAMRRRPLFALAALLLMLAAISGCFSWRPARRALRGCNDTGCGPEASSVVDVVKAVSLRLARAVDDEGNLRPRTVTANWDPVEGSQVNLAGASLVSVSGPDVTLTLASAVATGDAVTVSYAKPEAVGCGT